MRYNLFLLILISCLFYPNYSTAGTPTPGSPFQGDTLIAKWQSVVNQIVQVTEDYIGQFSEATVAAVKAGMQGVIEFSQNYINWTKDFFVNWGDPENTPPAPDPLTIVSPEGTIPNPPVIDPQTEAFEQVILQWEAIMSNLLDEIQGDIPPEVIEQAKENLANTNLSIEERIEIFNNLLEQYNFPVEPLSVESP